MAFFNSKLFSALSIPLRAGHMTPFKQYPIMDSSC